MRMFLALLSCSLFVTVWCGSSCKVEYGNRLNNYEGKKWRVDVPCKYNMVQQKCGNVEVTVTPGNRWLYPTYIWDRLWIGVAYYGQDGGVTYWKGNTNNRKIGKHIIAHSPDSGIADPDRFEAFNNYNSSYQNASEEFDISSDGTSVTLRDKNNNFELILSPYDFGGNKVSDSRVEFRCLSAPSDLKAFPVTYCGDNDGSVNEMKDEIFATFGTKPNKVKTKDIEKQYLYNLFKDNTIAQVEPRCIEATQIYNDETLCSAEKLVEATSVCGIILTSKGHTKCVSRYTCDPMDVFMSCMRYVCSDYDSGTPGSQARNDCETVAQGIDMCRNFPTLTDSIRDANCFGEIYLAHDLYFTNDA